MNVASNITIEQSGDKYKQYSVSTSVLAKVKFVLRPKPKLRLQKKAGDSAGDEAPAKDRRSNQKPKFYQRPKSDPLSSPLTTQNTLISELKIFFNLPKIVLYLVLNEKFVGLALKTALYS